MSFFLHDGKLTPNGQRFITLAVLGIMGWFALLLMLGPFFKKAATSPAEASTMNIRQIILSCKIYAADHNGLYPSTNTYVAEDAYNLLLIPSPYGGDKTIFYGPHDPYQVKIPSSSRLISSGELGYTYVFGLWEALATTSTNPSPVLVTERLAHPLSRHGPHRVLPGVHKGNGVNIGRIDSSVTFVPADSSGQISNLFGWTAALTNAILPVNPQGTPTR